MSRRLALAAFALPVLLLLAPAPLLAAPRDDLFAAWQKFLALKSFRATITGLEPRPSVTRLEFQAPDRYHIAVVGGATTTLIGDTATMDIGGRTMNLPVPVQSVTAQYRDEAFLKKLQQGMHVEDLGTDTLDGEAVRKLRYVQDVVPPAMPGAAPAPASPAPAGAGKATTVAWISVKNGLILRLQVDSTWNGQAAKSEIRYADFDDPTIVIGSPVPAAKPKGG